MTTPAARILKKKHFRVKHQKVKLFRANEPLLSVFMWGVNHTINELSHVNIPGLLLPDHFRAHSKIKVDYHLFNKENMPSHFKFKEYCPLVFKYLRERFAIDDIEYRESLTRSQPIMTDARGKSDSDLHLGPWGNFLPMVRSTGRLLAGAAVAAVLYSGAQLAAFVATPAPKSPGTALRHSSPVALSARGGGEYDVSDADIEKFYAETITGSGGDCPKGTVIAELIVKFFHGEFTPQGFKRYSGLWKGPPPGNIGKKDIEVGVAGLKAQMKNPMFVSKGGIGYGVDETLKVKNDGKGWVWLAAEMSPGGLAVELFQSVPYGKRALLVAKQSDVDGMFAKVNWDVVLARIEKTLGGPQIKQR